MRDAEEVAREALDNITGPMRRIFQRPEHAECLDALDVLVAQERERTADLIRARDAEVAEQVRAATLDGLEARFQEYVRDNRDELLRAAGFTEEARDACLPGGCPGASCRGRERRLVSPWEPEPRTPEQRSADAINRLRPPLTEPEDR